MAAISDDDIWLVGLFSMPDTSQSGSGDNSCNAIHWDGEKWKAHRLLGQDSNGDLSFSQLNSIYMFSSNDIWIAFGGAYAHWDGLEWQSKFFWVWEGRYGNITEIWGASALDLYFARTDGKITHYNGSSFSDMATGLNYTIIRIHGLDKKNIWSVAYSNIGAGAGIQNAVLEHKRDGSWAEIHHQDSWMENWPPRDYSRPSGIYNTTWAYGDTLYLGCASLWKESISTGEGYLTKLEALDWDLYYGIGFLDGNHCNDVFAFRVQGLAMTHYNGVNWKRDISLQNLDPGQYFLITEVAVIDNMVFIAGWDFRSGHILLIRGY
ncbi:MAG: hypothetical protein ACETWG_08805, partial [Candidatus Neomarinimicrobiota bacterium]